MNYFKNKLNINKSSFIHPYGKKCLFSLKRSKTCNDHDIGTYIEFQNELLYSYSFTIYFENSMCLQEYVPQCNFLVVVLKLFNKETKQIFHNVYVDLDNTESSYAKNMCTDCCSKMSTDRMKSTMIWQFVISKLFLIDPDCMLITVFCSSDIETTGKTFNRNDYFIPNSSHSKSIILDNIKEYPSSVRVLTWNILAPSLYSQPEFTQSNWYKRIHIIKNYITKFNSDIVNLSEVDESFVDIVSGIEYSFLDMALSFKGEYSFVYLPKTQSVSPSIRSRHGNLVMWKRDTFEYVFHITHPLDCDADTDNQIVIFLCLRKLSDFW